MPVDILDWVGYGCVRNEVSASVAMRPDGFSTALPEARGTPQHVHVTIYLLATQAPVCGNTTGQSTNARNPAQVVNRQYIVENLCSFRFPPFH
jgi:hypothetical protein